MRANLIKHTAWLLLCFFAAFHVQAQTDKPVADMLDVRFNADGTATDLSPMGMKVERRGTTNATYWNSTYQRYVANFSNPWSGYATGYYKVDYSTNQTFQNVLASGHTLETLIMADYDGNLLDAECKPFSSHQSGGTGFLITKKANGTNKAQNDICFLPHTGGSYRWAISGVMPQKKAYYHVVGVYNKATQKATIYINGEKKGEVSATGDLKLATSGNLWFCIGGDPDGDRGAQSWTGDVVLARVYGSALTATQVSALWGEVDELQRNAPAPWITNLHYNTGLPFLRGCQFAIDGEGFLADDQIALVNPADALATPYILEVTLTADGVTVVLPKDLEGGKYLMYVRRAGENQYLGALNLQFIDTVNAGAKVIAHRGYWTCLPEQTQNSRASLQAALDLGAYGSETDVWITTDGVLMVNHDASLGGVTVQSATSTRCKNVPLSNGEKMPPLADFLQMMKESDSSTKLIIEIKTHSTTQKTVKASQAAVAMVKEAGLQNRVEYIAFSLASCQALVEADPQAKVAYLNGDKSPAELNAVGVTGLDYTLAVLRAHPTWVDEAHRLGMTVNVWTIDTQDEMVECNLMGVDYITTNYPEVAECVRQHFDALYYGSENAIPNLKAEHVFPTAVYNLAGQRVVQARKGVYILGGKKVVVK